MSVTNIIAGTSTALACSCLFRAANDRMKATATVDTISDTTKLRHLPYNAHQKGAVGN